MIFIPDGRTKNMSTLSTKVDVAKVAGKDNWFANLNENLFYYKVLLKLIIIYYHVSLSP